MKITFLLCSLLYLNTSFSQNSLRILGKWYTCGRVDTLKNIQFQKFIRKELSPDSCKKAGCSISTWEFRKDTFYHHSLSGCNNETLGFATIASGLSWSFNTASKQIIITDETRKKVKFDIITLTDSELIVLINKTVHIDSFYIDESEINSNRYKEFIIPKK